ncbi:XdhC family protein [Ochrobactrum sp. CM-21-5]|nr:XdhC family protein [Ochrobactrum sp. CM-21-5]MBC2885458.1 XdhC family protein [Ochrobactrum sp. CM-21-5]
MNANNTELDGSDGAIHPALIDPWQAALNMSEGTVIAVLTATHGSAYRNLGAAMAIAPDNRWVGAVTSGCVEADIALHACDVRSTGRSKRLRYGVDSPYFDIRLPCGGAIEIMLFPLRDRLVLQALAERRRKRLSAFLRVSPDGRLSLGRHDAPASGDGSFIIPFYPQTRFVILGAGPEALVFTQMIASLGRSHVLLSHDQTTLRSTGILGITSQSLTRLSDLRLVPMDANTAVTLFYHDHDHEPEILRHVLASDAFYIGAQGSARAHRTRLNRLEVLGVSEQDRKRVRGPIGMIPSTRDPQALAASVLAEITQEEARRANPVPATPVEVG